MREIKFRGRSVHADDWCYGSFVNNPDEPTICGFDIWADGDRDWSEEKVEPTTVGQFTGLHDKNGKEIYEGDILDVTVFDCFDRDRQYRVLVEWVGTEFMGMTNDDDAWNLGWLCSQDEEIEVIGNVHDNPELLKGGEK